MPLRQFAPQNQQYQSPMQGPNYLSGYGMHPWQQQQQQAVNQSPITMGDMTMPQAQQQGSPNWLSRFGSMFGGAAQAPQNAMNTIGGMGAQGWGNVIQGVGGIGSLWLAQNQLKQGKKEFKFNRGMAEANLANSASLINTQVSRRAESNAASLGMEGEEANAYVEERKQKESVRGKI